MIGLRTVFEDLIFNLATISWIELLDLALVALVYYLLLNLLRRSRATVLLRGTLVLVAIFFIFTVFTPLPTFDFLLQIAVIAVLIATPVIFQSELRLALEQLGRGVSSFNLRKIAAGVTLKPLVRALENLSDRYVGALIVLEGEDSLDDILETGVPVGAEVTSELLQTIFYEGTPLHDGATIVRGDTVLAAGCVLPVSNRQLYTGQRRLGTRHRAAVGLSESSDALVLVVSEETGQISVARHGRLESDLDKTAVRDYIHTFYNPPEESKRELSAASALAQLRRWWREGTRGRQRKLLSDGTLLLFSVLLALATWTYVLQQTRPISQERVEGIPLRITGVPSGTQLLEQPPDTVTALVKASEPVVATLGPESFRASVSLAGRDPGLHRLQVNVDSSVRPVQIVNVEPDILDLQLVEIISQTVPVEVVIQGDAFLSPALDIVDEPVATPSEVVVTGSETRVERVVSAITEVQVADATGPIQEIQPIVAIDENGNPVAEVTIQPSQVEIKVDIARRATASEVGIEVDTRGSLPVGYRLAQLTVTPAQVILLGEPGQLAEAGSIISTAPIDLRQATGDLQVQMPLVLPAGVEAIGVDGETVRSVSVNVDVEPEMANRRTTRPVTVLGSAGLFLSLDPVRVELLTSGPVPVLNEIAQDPSLLQVVVDAADLTDLEPGQTIQVTPTVIKPGAVDVQLIPEQISITASEN